MTLLKTVLRSAACALALLPAMPATAKDADAASGLPPSRTAATPSEVRPALWKIADDDTTIWLFGTIHILPETVAWYAGPVAAAFDESGELVTEIPIDKASQSQTLIMEKSKREDGKLLRDTLSVEERAKYEAGMAAIGLPPQIFDGNDPWYAALMLTLIPLKVAGYDLESGVDHQVSDKALDRHMKNAALETADYQISLFDTLPDAIQRRYLDDVLDALPTATSDIGAMVTAWKHGNADELARLMNEEEDDATLREVLLTNRNMAWAKWLKARMEQPGTVFVAVGAGHLAGRDSVQDQLRRLGVPSSRVQ